MALETLKGIETIDGYNVIVMDELREKQPDLFDEGGGMDYKKFEKSIRPNFPVQIRHDKNSISFTIQNGPEKEAGKNGCQVDTIIKAATIMLDGLNSQFPCRENAIALTKLQEACMWLGARKLRRMAQGIEGTSNEV
jgi:hypothetical protein